MRRVLPLDGTWRFLPDLRDAGVRQGWPSARLRDGDWRSVPVPAAWDEYAEEFRGYEGVAWFRRRFTLTGSRPRVARLRFEGAGHEATVWLNGRLLGGHRGAYGPFEFDAAAALRPGANVLAVRISHLFSDSTNPMLNTDWWKYGGITRPVSLLLSDGPAIDRLTVTVSGEPGSPVANVRGRVAGMRGESLRLVVRAGPEHRRRADTSMAASADFSIPFRAGDLPRWSPDHPRLVPLAVELRDADGTVLDRARLRFGVRTVQWDGGVLRLDGRRLRLRGVNQVEEYPGRTVSPSNRWTCSPPARAVRARLLDLKRGLHGNWFRAAHYPHHPRVPALCDELGLLMPAEIPLCYTPERADTTAEGRRMFEELFWRDAHHPSVIMWSMGNERPTNEPATAAGVVRLIRFAKTLDPSRPVTCVSNRGLGDRSLHAHDVLVLNEYYGVWGGTTPVTSAGLPTAARDLSRELDRLHRAFPDKPLVIGEFGTPAFPVRGNVFGGERFQAEFYRTQTRVLASKPWLSGCTAWCYTDQRIGSYRRYPVGYLGSTQLEVFGLTDFRGRRRPAYRALAAFYRRMRSRDRA